MTTEPSSAAALRDAPCDPAERSAAEMEGRHVHAVYEVIAVHFSSTRFAIWPKVCLSRAALHPAKAVCGQQNCGPMLTSRLHYLQVREFLMSLPHRAALADVGCGNGKYFRVRPDLVVFGSDRSSGLAEQAAKLCRGASAPASTCNGSSAESPLDRSRTADIDRANGEADGATAGHDPVPDRPKALHAPLADVLVADALRLPYQVCAAAFPGPVAFSVDPPTSHRL